MVKTHRIEIRVTRREAHRLREQADLLGVRHLSEFIRHRLLDEDLRLLQQKLTELHDHLLGPHPPVRARKTR